MTSLISDKLKATMQVDAHRYGRSDRSPMGRWFWEIDRVLLLMVAGGLSILAVRLTGGFRWPRSPAGSR